MQAREMPQDQIDQIVAARQQEREEEALVTLGIATRDFKSSSEWEAYSENLMHEIRDIERDLKDPTIRSNDYWEWRKKARHAYFIKMAQYRQAKKQVTQAKQAERFQRLRLEVGSPEDLLDQFRRMVGRWLADGLVTGLRPGEQRLMDLAAAYFEVLRQEYRHGTTPGTGGFSPLAEHRSTGAKSDVVTRAVRN